MDPSIHINWKSPFPIWGVSGVHFHFYSISLVGFLWGSFFRLTVCQRDEADWHHIPSTSKTSKTLLAFKRRIHSIYCKPASVLRSSRFYDLSFYPRVSCLHDLRFCIRPVWSESSLCASWIAKDSCFLCLVGHWTHKLLSETACSTY